MKSVLKKALLLVLALSLTLGMTACVGDNEAQTSDADSVGESTEEGSTDTLPEDTDGEDEKGGDSTVKNSLDGKKIIFIGNSYTYYGQTVLEKSQTYLTQSERTGDKGYFYQLCHANGMDAEVTNWTYGAHDLISLFGGNCAADRGCDGEDHKAYLKDKSYDYVVIQIGTSEAADTSFSYWLEYVMDFFREANPDVRFAILVPYNAYGTIGSVKYLSKNTLDLLKTLEDNGVTVVEWGRLVYDIIGGETVVPNASCSYNKNTFVIEKSAKDGYHPNQLSGYITTLMTYCALTGASAQGQTYDFCNDSSLRPKGGDSKFFSFSNFISKYYTYNGATTNYTSVFNSNADMAGLQLLIDKYLDEKPYRSYNYTESGGDASTDTDSEAVAAGKVAKLANGGTESYLTLSELEAKITNGYTHGDHITLLTDATCKGATSGNMKNAKTVSVTFDLNAKTLTLTKGSIMRTTYKDGYVSTFNLISSNGKGTLTLAEGNKYTAFQLYGNDKTVVIGSEVGYTDGDCVVINCTNFLYTSTYGSNDASSTSVKMYGGEVNKISTTNEAEFIVLWGRGFSDTENYLYYYGSVEFVGVKIEQKVSTSMPLFTVGYYNDLGTYTSDYLPTKCSDAPGITLTDCEIVGYTSESQIHDIETLNGKITYNNCKIAGDVSTTGTDKTDTGLGNAFVNNG